MRLILYSVAAILAASSQRDSTSLLIQQLRAGSWVVRSRAYLQIRSNPALHTPQVKNALVELADRENGVVDHECRYGNGVDNKFGEEYSEYYGQLGETLMTIVTVDDKAALRVLVRGAYGGTSLFAQWLARFGNPVVLPLVKLTKSDRTFCGLITRGTGIEVLGLVVEQQKKGTIERALSGRTVSTILSILEDGLKDPDAGVRMSAIRAVTAAGDTSAIPLLDRLRTTDPQSRVGPGGVVVYDIRARAEKAIAIIREKNGQ